MNFGTGSGYPVPATNHYNLVLSIALTDVAVECTEYVNVPVPVEVDSSDTRRGGDFNVAESGRSASGTGNRTSSARGAYFLLQHSAKSPID